MIDELHPLQYCMIQYCKGYFYSRKEEKDESGIGKDL